MRKMTLRRALALTLIALLCLNLVLFAVLRYDSLIFWGVIIAIVAINYLFFNGRKNQKTFKG